MDYNNRKFMIFNVSELPNINFDEVLETSIDTVSKSSNQTKTLVKWDGETPTCVSNLTTKEGPTLTLLSIYHSKSPKTSESTV